MDWESHQTRQFEGRLARGESEHENPVILYPTRKRNENRSESPIRQRKDTEFLLQSKDKTPLEVMEDDVEVGVSIGNTTLRGYQLEIFRAALERNIVAFLGTGCGKTLIAVQLMKQIAQKCMAQGRKSLMIFFAPTVNLVKQQAEVITGNTDLKVLICHGQSDSGWNAQKWKTQTALNEVIVMTPQIFHESLQFSFLSLDMVDLLIFDECHHASGGHPYAKIMKDFYKKCEHKPKIFGMTASPLKRKGTFSNIDCENQIAKLEDILDSQVYTLEDRTEVEEFAVTPEIIIKEYEKPSVLQDSLIQELDHLKDKAIQNQHSHRHHRLRDEANSNDQFRDEANSNDKIKKDIQKIHLNIIYCLNNLGLFCAYEAVRYYHQKESEKTRGFLTDALNLFKQVLPADMDTLFKTSEGYNHAVENGLLTPKVDLLVRLILEQSNVESMRCIIFVDRVVVAAVISSLIRQLHLVLSVACDYVSRVETSSMKKQQKKLEDFSNGTVKLLVSTDVVEEGIDVQRCSCVIRFDLPKTTKSFIQSRGRARQRKSKFILLLERGNKAQQEKINRFIKSEESMMEMSLNRNSNSNHTRCITEEKCIVETDVYRVPSTGATITLDTCVGLVNKYCSKLPGDKYYTPKAEFITRNLNGDEKLYECILKLPPNAPVHEVISPPHVKPTVAKQLVCLEACKRLHQIGALDDHLQPNSDELPEKKRTNSEEDDARSHAGITKKKELHSSKRYALSGKWGENLNGVNLHAYKLYFTSQCNERTYASFVLLLEEKLDQDIVDAETDLFLPDGRVKSYFSHCGDMELNSSELKAAKSFHEIIFNGVFAKLLARDKKSKGLRFLADSASNTVGMKKLWSNSNMYFILPTEDDFGACQREAKIDWELIRYCASGAILLKSHFGSEKSSSCVIDNFEALLKRNFLQYSVRKEEAVTLASGIYKASDLIDKAIVAVHTGRIYTVVEVIRDKTAKSPFPESKASKDKYSSYSDYFEKKYGKILKYVDQPLLRVKHTHRPHSLLTNHADQQLKTNEPGSNNEEASHVELPPELCIDLGVSSFIIGSLYLIPSVIYRLNCLVQAGQLRKAIREEHPKCPLIPVTLIMEAFTTSRCLEPFSYERLELLGDSILKYAISGHLFLKYEEKHEGQLSALRARRVSNVTLHSLAMARNLQEYIREEPFDPRRWAVPGMLSKKEIPCKCKLENLGKHGEGDELAVNGKSCDEGHRWMSPKTISDAVEALIGAHFVGGGTIAAFEFMKWMNMDVDFGPDLAEAACQRACVNPYVLKETNLPGLESLLGYEFQNKALLVEAITHASQQDPEGCCYQRLEFLGDSVMDFLITRHFYSTYPALSPGILTDMRSAAVNNENFARAAVKSSIQKYLRHGSGALMNQITKFATAVGKIKEGECRFMSFGGVEAGPKVLGDMIESIAGAIFLDMKLDFESVWGIMKPILSPIVTPETLELQPQRELQELCSKNQCNVVWDLKEQGEEIVATGTVRLKNHTIVGTGTKENKKSAKMAAAQQILLRMEDIGFYHSRRPDVQKPTLDTTSIRSAQEKINCVVENAANVTKGKGKDQSVEKVLTTLNANINLKALDTTSIRSAQKMNCLVENAANVTKVKGKDQSIEKVLTTLNANINSKAEQVTANTACVQTKDFDMTLTHKVGLSTASICFAHDEMGGDLENATKDEFVEQVPGAINGDASSACVQMEEPDMVVSESHCPKRKRYQDNPVCDNMMFSINEDDAYLHRYEESIGDMDNIPITTREFSVEEIFSLNAQASRCRQEEEMILHHYPVQMKRRLLDNLVISRTSEHLDQIDNVNQNWYPDGCSTSGIITSHGLEKNRIQYGQLDFSQAGLTSNTGTAHGVEKNSQLCAQSGFPPGGLPSSNSTSHGGEKNILCAQSGFPPRGLPSSNSTCHGGEKNILCAQSGFPPRGLPSSNSTSHGGEKNIRCAQSGFPPGGLTNSNNTSRRVEENSVLCVQPGFHIGGLPSSNSTSQGVEKNSILCAQSGFRPGGLTNSNNTSRGVEKNSELCVQSGFHPGASTSNISTPHGVEKNGLPCGQSGFPPGGLTSSNSSSHRVEKNSTHRGKASFSPAFWQRIHDRGGPRAWLYEICAKNKWLAPVFKCEERGLPHDKRFNFTVEIPRTDFVPVPVRGEVLSSKKTAQDSAATVMLYELQKKGVL